MLNKKAQAVGEFSITSAFSLLAVFVLLAGLWYFGIFNFINVMPQKCILPAGISCVDYSVSSSKVGFVLMNNLGVDIIVDDIRLYSCHADSPKAIGNNEMQVFELDCNIEKGSIKTDFYIDFRKKSTNMTNTWEGELVTQLA
ncbi:hypothetical protein KY311_02840 [Candidatus Woesearchaeota archaeon]|nr:hypothetical protein [Candidatus Woesearchaeota archaeon]